MLLNPLTFHTPTTLSEATQLYGKLENVKLHAGGTFLLNALKLLKRKGAKSPDHVITLSKIEELKGLAVNGDQLVIKAMTTIDELFESPLLQDNFKIFHTVCRNISTQPIRNTATVGGNLTCRYTWTEMPAVMVGLQAEMHFIDAAGQEHSLPAEEFFKANAKTDKIFTHVTIKRDKNCTIAYRRVKKTQYVDIPMLSTFIKTTFNGDRFTDTVVSINNCVAFAQRDTKLEEFLNQSSCSDNLAEEALNHIEHSIYDTRSTDYKKHMFRLSIKDSINELIQSKQNT